MVFFRDAEIQQNGFGMADVQVSVGLWRKARNDLFVFAAFQIARNDLFDKVVGSFRLKIHLACPSRLVPMILIILHDNPHSYKGQGGML